MEYPGNPSLSDEIKTRILSTFRQTMSLAEEGRVQEANLGCDFILKMDALFAPARTLKERLASTPGPVDTEDLLNPGATGGMRAPAVAVPGPRLEQRSGVGVLRGASALPDPDSLVPAGDGETTPVAGAADDTASGATNAIPDSESGPSWGLPPPTGHVETASPSGLDGDFDLGPIEGALDSLEPAGRDQPRDPLASLDLAPSVVGSRRSGAVPKLVSGAFEGPLDLDQTGTPPPSDDPATRIRRLLDEGQQAFDAGELQSAIDAWSRIFLIDVDHQEASSHIEKARRLKAEQERHVDQILDEALRARSDGRLEDAREGFEKLLELDPTHLAARDYLEQLDRGELGPSPESEGEAREVPGATGQRDGAGRRKAASFPRVSGVARRNRTGQLAAVLVAVLVLVAGWYLYSHRSSLFPNAGPTEAAIDPGADLLARAQSAHDAGNVEEAIGILRSIPPASPERDRSRELLAAWQSELESEPDVGSIEDVDETKAQVEAERAALLEQARRAYGQREYLEASRIFHRAEQIAPLEGPDQDLYTDARQQLLPIAQQIDLFRQREWEMVLAPLWRRYQDDPANRDVRRILADSYFNLGLRELKREAPSDASAHFRELQELTPEDPMADRLLVFADTYRTRRPDLLYEIFVGELEYRQ